MTIPEDAEELEKTGVELTEEKKWRRKINIYAFTFKCPKCGSPQSNFDRLDINLWKCRRCGALLEGKGRTWIARHEGKQKKLTDGF